MSHVRTTHCSLHPKMSTNRLGRGGKPGPVDPHAARDGRPWSRSGSRRPGEARAGMRAEPILRSGSGRLRRGRGRVLFPRGGGAGQSCRRGMLRTHHMVNAGHRLQLKERDQKLRTVDISPRRQRRILRQGLGYIVVGSIDIVIFLGGGGEGSASWLRSMTSPGGAHLSGRCRAS
jgi:hypothetical protein